MSTPTNHWKLGLFMTVGIAAIIGTIIFFGGRSLKKETVPYKTYFDESVQGLEIGSPVKFRGVSIGNVSDISLAGNKRHVEVTYELGVKVLNSLGLAAEKAPGAKTRLVVPKDLRVQLASAGITGVKFIQLDFFEEKSNPPLELPFEVPENYIPAVASMMKNLEDSVVSAVDQFPELANQLLLVFTRVSTILTGIEDIQLPQKLAETLTLINAVLNQVNNAIVAIDPKGLSTEAQTTLKTVNTAVIGLNQVLAKVNSDRGLVASVQRTSDALGSMATNANHVGPAMEDALRDVQGAAQSVQRLADALELDPDMLIKGRARRVAK